MSKSSLLCSLSFLTEPFKAVDTVFLSTPKFLFNCLAKLFYLSLDYSNALLLRTPIIDSLQVTDNRTGRSYVVPVEHNSIRAIDLRAITTSRLLSKSSDRIKCGLRVVDPGYQNTAVKQSQITYVDGYQGIIQFRQYPIEYLWANNDFEDVAFLLIWGRLPSIIEKTTFQSDLAIASEVPQSVINVIKSLPRDAPCFSMVLAGLSAFAGSDPALVPIHAGKNLYQGNLEQVDRAIIRTLAAVATVVTLVYCHRNNKAFTPADPQNSFVENIVQMMGLFEKDGKTLDRKIIRNLERLWILFADHEMTNSTSAFLHAASALGDPITCCVSALGSACGPLHAGAIDLAYKQFGIVGTPGNVAELIEQVKARKQRLYGYGHRIYKKDDPRSKLIRVMMNDMLEKVETNPLLAVALEIDKVASKDEYFTSRGLKVNADLYGCFIYTALGFEPEIVPALTAIARASGWMAHWREAMSQSPCLWRPQQIFTGKVTNSGIKIA